MKLSILTFLGGPYLGGAEGYSISLTGYLSKRGHSCHYVSDYIRRPESLPEPVTWKRVCGYGFDYGKRPSFRKRLDQFIRLFQYRRAIAQVRPDVIHTVLPWHDFSHEWLRCCNRAGTPHLITFQLVRGGMHCSKTMKEIIRKAREAGAVFCAISRNNQGILADYFPVPIEEIRVIPNRPDPEKISASVRSRDDIRAELGWSDKIIILTVGSLVHQKGHDLIIPIAARIKAARPSSLFVWAGDGNLYPDLQRQVQEADLEEAIQMLGRRNDVADLLKAADVFLFPTRFEGGESLALMEAGINRLAVVASDASGIPELIRDGQDGLLFPVDDSEAMERQLLKLLDSRSSWKVFGESIQSRLREYQWEDMCRDTENLLHEAVRINKKP